MNTTCEDVDDKYECPKCWAEFTPEDLGNVEQAGDDEEINTLLQEIEDVGPVGAFGEKRLGSVDVGPLEIMCPKCGEESIQINVCVTATPVYEDYDHPNKMPNVSHFEDIEIVEVLPPDAPLHHSLMYCFESVEFDSDYDYLPNLEECEFFEEQESELLIVAKTKMSNGYCYIGWDVDKEELVRPILKTTANLCCWLTTDPPLEVGEVHSFKVAARNIAQIPPPHRADDVQIEYCVRSPIFHISDLYNLLAPFSHERVEDVFGNAEIREKKYIVEGTCCPSVGIYRCKKGNVKLYVINRHGKERCELKQEAGTDGAEGGHLPSFDLPTTFLVYAGTRPVDEDVLVVLGLARPWAGKGAVFTPKRCYLLVVGIINKVH